MKIVSILIAFVLLFTASFALACDSTADSTVTQSNNGNWNINNAAVIQNSNNVTVTQNGAGKKYYTTKNEYITENVTKNEYLTENVTKNEYITNVTNEYITNYIQIPDPVPQGVTVEQQVHEINQFTSDFIEILSIILNEKGYDILYTPEQTNRNCACAYSVTFYNRNTRQTVTKSLIIYSHSSGRAGRTYNVALVTKYIQGMKITKYDSDLVVFREVTTEEARQQILVWLEIGMPNPAAENTTYQAASQNSNIEECCSETECHCCGCCGCK